MLTHQHGAQVKELEKMKAPVEKLKKEKGVMKEKEASLKTERRRKQKQHEGWRSSMEAKAEEIEEQVAVAAPATSVCMHHAPLTQRCYPLTGWRLCSRN